MEFTRQGPGKYLYKGVTYYELECGGGGNCLFLSLAYLLRLYNVEPNVGHSDLRQRSAAMMQGWVGNYPITLPGDLPPTQQEADDMANDREWGTATSLQATIMDYDANRGGLMLEIHVLGPTTDDLRIFFNPTAEAPDITLYLFFSGFTHYRALVPEAFLDTVPDQMRIDKIAAGNAKKPKKKKMKFMASLKNSDSSASKANTFSIPDDDTKLEIHNIDVGQGDATLILIRDENDAILKTVLVDAGITGYEVVAYLEDRIKQGDFRPIDIFVCSHYDSDHIGGAPLVLNNEKYVQPDIAIYDIGDWSGDSDFDNYAQIKLADRREVISLDQPLIDDFHGITLSCVYHSGLMRGNKDGEVYPVQMGGFYKLGGVPSEVLPNVGDKNAFSVALLLTFGAFRYFTAGDLYGFWEFETVRWGDPVDHVCAWKLGHHGAAEASEPGVLECLRPRFGVISCGSDNTHGHPALTTIARLETLNGTYDCAYSITAKVVPPSGRKFAAQPPGAFGLDEEGTVVISVTAKQAARHEFTVDSNGRAGEVFACGERPRIKIFEPENKVKRQRANTTEEDKRKQEERRRERRVQYRRFLEKRIKKQISNNDWLSDPNVDAQLKRLADRLRGAYGEDYEDAKGFVDNHLAMYVINSADDLRICLSALW